MTVELTVWESAKDSSDRIWFEATKFEKEGLDYWRLEKLAYEFDLGSGAITGPLPLSPSPEVPADLFRQDNRLRTWSEIAEHVTGAARKAVDQAIDALRHLSVHVAAGDTFFGATSIGGFSAEYRVDLDLDAMISREMKLRTLFSAVAVARFGGGGFRTPFTSMAVDASLSIAIAFLNDTTIKLTPRIDVDKLPNLAICWPDIPVKMGSNGALSFDHFDLAALDRLLSLPLPEAPVSVDWTQKPTLKFKLTGADLTIYTEAGKEGDGAIKVRGKDSDEPWLDFDGFALTVANQKIDVSVASLRPSSPTITILKEIEAGPFRIKLDAQVTVWAEVDANIIKKLTAKITVHHCEISARNDPSLVLAASFELDIDLIDLKPDSTKLRGFKLIAPYPIDLALAAAHIIQDGARRLWSLIQRIDIPPAQTPDLTAIIGTLRRVAELVAAAITWLTEQGVAGARTLAGLAESALKLLIEALDRLFDKLKDAGNGLFEHITVELRFDAATWKLVQVVVTPRVPKSTDKFDVKFLGFDLEVPWQLSPALVADLENNWIAFVLQISGGNEARLWTDLWFDTPTAPSEQVSSDSPQGQQHLLEVSASLTPKAPTVALVVLNQGRAQFFQKLVTGPLLTQPVLNSNHDPVVLENDLLLGTAVQKLEPIVDDDIKIDVKLQTDRILSLFNIPRSAGPFSQHIRVTCLHKPTIKLPKVGLKLECEVLFSDIDVKGPIEIDLDLSDLSVALKAGRFVFEIPSGESKSLFGLDASFAAKSGTPKTVKALYLDLSSGNPVLGLTDEARLDLAYTRLSADRRGLGFEVDKFKVGRDGVDLAGRIKKDPVTLSGVDMPFRFEQGELAIERSRIREFSLEGYGNLPPALVGEAKATIKLAFRQTEDGRLAVQACEAELKSADPLRSENTRMTLAISKLGLRFVEDGANRDYHFYFTLTGAAQFHPNGDEFDGGLLKHLSKLKIVLNEVPLAADPRVLLRHIEFQVPVEPPDRTNFFDLFSFELRGIGFHPAASAFDGDPALSISGQINFTKAFDVVSPRFDFHKMWIAKPAQGSLLPRVRFDGLGVGLQLGPSVHVEGTGVAVDGDLDSLYPSPLPAENLNGKGFVAAGSLRIDGWGSMSANMGFLELGDPKGLNPDKRHAFYLYVQQNDLSEPIPTPIGNIYLREVGFGFGHRYTLAGLAAADDATTPQQLVSLLDDVSKIQGNLHEFSAWRPQYDSDELTLALRGLLSLTTASARNGPYNEAKEKELPNPVLFDIVAALRTDLTFLMNIRAWIAYNYNDWREARESGGADWQRNPPLRGYMYLSARKHVFLARSISDGSGAVGKHPELPEPLVKAMQSVRWSSTVYVTPSIFHMEFGWPYELQFDLGKESDRFFVSANGGLVLRYEDSALLHGLAFRARGHAKFDADTGGSVGASVSAIARFDLGAKLISYISARFSESLLYGELTLDVTVSFSVRAWLRTRWFSLSAGFSVSLTIHIALELVVSPKGVGGRVEASVGVSVFGRRLSVGVSFSFNNDKLADARSRVARFMQLGLGATYPDPTKGVAPDSPALPESQRANNAERADQAIKDEAERREVLAPPNVPPPADPNAIWDQEGKIKYTGSVDYWAMLVPIPGTGGLSYVIQLLPKGSESFDDPKQFADRNFFYAPPLDTEVVGEPPTTQVYEITGDDGLAPLDLGKGKGYVDWGNRMGLPRTGDGEPPKLAQFMRVGCFMAGASTEPDPIFWSTDTNPMPEDPEAFDRACADAARSRADLGLFGKRCQQVEEARSAFISTVGQAVAELAQLARIDGGRVTIDPLAPDSLEFDPRALGLTFAFVNDGETDPYKVEDAIVAILDKMSVKARQLGSGKVQCFNPPSRMFNLNPPSLVDPNVVLSDGLQLHWDLEPAWKRSETIESDPEYHLKHYRIERTIRFHDETEQQPKPRLIVAKGADQILMVGHNSKDKVRSARLQWTRLQVVDDFSDLPEDKRKLILPPPPTTNIDAPAPDNKKATISYRIVPVDIAGTEGLITPLSFTTDDPKKIQLTVANPILTFDFRGELPTAPKPVGAGDDIEYRLLIELPGELEPAANYTLRARIETRHLGSTFGDDALEDALNAPLPPGREDLTPRINELDLTITDTAPPKSIKFAIIHIKNGKPLEKDKPPKQYYVDTVAWNALREGLGITELKHVATRFYVRPQPVGGATISPAWVAVRVQIQAGMKDTKKSDSDDPHSNLRAVDISLERFEYPLATRFAALGADDIPPIESGRLHVLYPVAGTSFADFAEGEHAADGTALVEAMNDSERRTGVRLAWNAFPSKLDMYRPPEHPGTYLPPAEERHGLLGGFDLFALDAANVPRSVAKTREVFDFAKPLGRVHRLTRAEGNQWPAETGDFAKVQYLYPSEHRRLKSAERGEKRARWYSPAESFLRWPDDVVRRSLITSIDEPELAKLFARGVPNRLFIELSTPSVEFDLASDASCHAARPWAGDPAQQLELKRDKLTVDVNDVRRALLSLYLQPKKLAPKALDAAVTIVVTAKKTMDKDDGTTELAVTGTAEFILELADSRHAVLADVLDLVKYKSLFDGTEGLVYRGYEVLAEPVPSVSAQSMQGFLDATPADRDPAGWGILRMLGLAASFRLYDAEAGEFCDPKVARQQLSRAMAAVLARYDKAFPAYLGTPFVDVLGTLEGMAEFASFDGAPQGEGATDRARNNAVGLLQVELRPEVWVTPTHDYKRVVRYARVKRHEDAGTVVLAGTDKLKDVLIELLPTVLTDKLPAGTQILLLNGAGSPTFPPVSGSPIHANAVFPPAKADKKPAETICYVRFVALTREASLNDGDLTEIVADGAADVTLVDAPPCLTEGEDEKRVSAETWGRFIELPSTWLAEMLFQPTPENRRLTTADTVTQLSHYLGKRKDGQEAAKIPTEHQKRAALANALGPWTRRFMELGSPAPGKPMPAQLGFAVILRPDPWRIAADASGRLSVLLLEKDRYGKARKYAIRPYGRYDGLEAAVLAAVATPEARADWLKRTKPGLTDDDAVLGSPDNVPSTFARKFVDAVIERSEPLPAPVILGTRQVIVPEANGGGTPKNRHIAEVAISRHGEEVLADANITTDAGLAVRHLAVGMWREFSNVAWADAVQSEAKLPDWTTPNKIELLDPFGPGHDGEILPPDPRNDPPVYLPGGAVGLTPVRELYDLHPDLWRGAYGLRFGELPYGFRFHILAHLAAGAVVSPSSKATLTPAALAMRKPWLDKITPVHAGGWINAPLPAPDWDIDGDKLVVKWPLVRLIDIMSNETIETWFKTGNAPDLYRLPDSTVSYRLVVQSEDGASQTPEIDIAAVASDQISNKAAYTVRSIGRRLDVTPQFIAPPPIVDPPIDPLVVDYLIKIDDVPTRHYAMDVKLKLRDGDALSPSKAEFAPVLPHTEDPQPQHVHVGPLRDGSRNPWWAIAGTAAEGGAVKARILPPQDPLPPKPPAKEWPGFKKQMDDFIAQLKLYDNDQIAQRHRATIKLVIKTLEAYAVDRTADWPGHPNPIPQMIEVDIPWVLGLPSSSTPPPGDPLAIQIISKGPKIWSWYSTPEREEFGEAPIVWAYDTFELPAEYKASLIDGMLRTLTQMKLVKEEQPINGRAPLRRKVDSGKPKPPPSSALDVVYHFSMNEGGTSRPVYVAFDAIEAMEDRPVAPTLDGLRTMPKATEDTAVMVHGSALGEIEPILKSLDGTCEGKPWQLLLRKPATEIERKALHDPDWIAVANELTQEMVLGPRRKLVLQCLLGKLDPVYRNVEIKP